ncbi:protein phosphatase 2C domain-containing protein [Besnoitia besnoiti]|uniref:Protein phosphatase n=1 Tax=Besnoitia besnoiti TaxID=94643 RepID=A0A2A9M193_BESBE|nr:protein phosphatase 2C domain-containing protein [Besnoitia besnoiti]PFH31739.1 protein phosphatase 2C domain-containing protein [Besnoitia besnoiti]
MQREAKSSSPCCCGCPHASETEFYQNADSNPLPQLYFYACGKSRQHPMKGGPFKSTNADAFLIDRQVLGIADGVSSVEAEGYDPARLPVELLTECSLACRSRQQCPSVYDAESENLWAAWGLNHFVPQQFPLHILSRAHASCSSWGATTCVLSILEQNYLWTVNIGDSQALLLRRTNTPPRAVPVDQYSEHELCHSSRSRIGDLSQCGGYQVIHRVSPQQHFFNCPFQLTRMPDVDCSVGEVLRRTAESADVSGHEVQAGDILVMGSDGLFDNLFDEDILQVVNQLCWGRSRPGEIPSTEPHLVAEKLLEMAMDAASAPTGPEKAKLTPYAEGAYIELGKRLYGGKPDDITVVVGYVLDRRQSSEGTEGDASRTAALDPAGRSTSPPADRCSYGIMDISGPVAADKAASRVTNCSTQLYAQRFEHQNGYGAYPGTAGPARAWFTLQPAGSYRGVEQQTFLQSLKESHLSAVPQWDTPYASLAATVASSRRSFPPSTARWPIVAPPACVASVHALPPAFNAAP